MQNKGTFLGDIPPEFPTEGDTSPRPPLSMLMDIRTDNSVVEFVV